MSAFGGKADIAESAADVRSWPYPDNSIGRIVAVQNGGLGTLASTAGGSQGLIFREEPDAAVDGNGRHE